MKALAILAVLALSACATDGPAYWMKAYPNASAEKTQKCLAVADAVYAKELKGNMDGAMWAGLHKGNAWEKCQDGK